MTNFWWLVTSLCPNCIKTPFIKHGEIIPKFEETGDLNNIYKNKLRRACFTHDAAYSHGKDLAKITILDKLLKDKAYEITSNPKYDEYHRGLVGMVHKFFDKKTGSGTNLNDVLAQQLH